MEEKRYFVYAYDKLYEGMHDMYDWIICKCSFEEACEVGKHMSVGVIESYDCIYDELANNLEEGEDIEEEISYDIDYEIYELKNDAPSTKEIYELGLAPNDIINEYCVVN